MTTAVQRRRGTSTEHATFTGLDGEITVNTTTYTAHIHDGATVGGVPLAKADGSNIVTSSIDINGGTIDGTVIGGTTAAAITGTTITGTSFVSSGDMTFEDNDKAVFGDGSDLRIYHTGSHSTIENIGTGHLQIHTTDFRLRNSAGTESMILANADGNVQLFYDNAEKLATTATGIDVTGTVTADGLSLDNAQYINFKNSSNVSTRSLGINVANTFYIGGIDADIGDILFVDGGATRASFANGGDISFYEDTGTTAKFFWDASAERLGIGNSAPTQTLEVTGGIRATVTPSNTVQASLLLANAATTSAANLQLNTSGGLSVWSYESGGAGWFNSATIASSGNVGIGTSSPTGAKLQVVAESGSNVLGVGTTTQGLFIKTTGTTVDYNSSGNSGGEHTFSTGNIERMRIDVSGNVGIGTSSPSRKVSLVDSVNGYNLELQQTSAYNSGNQSGIVFSAPYNIGGSVTDLASIRGGKENATDEDFGGKLAFYTRANGGSDTERMRIDSSGRVTMPYQPAFNVNPLSDQNNIAINTPVTVIFNTEVFDVGSNFASNTFTAPVTGKYQLNLALRLHNIDTAADFYQIKFLTSNRSYLSTADYGGLSSNPNYWTEAFSVLADMDANDTVSITVSQSGGSVQTDIHVETTFSGYLVA
jgi:hypothetical protein